jgi:hypothetical protein
VSGKRRATTFLCVILLFSFVAWNLYGQGPGGRGAPQTPQTAKAAAPIDLTGYWVSVITEDWRYRMLTPPKGDYVGVPLNAESRKVADAWDPVKDEAAGEQCKAYGAASIMRVPGRIHVTWQDDQTLKIETDSGTQTRTFYFGAPQGEAGGWQGVSQASWEFLPAPIAATDGGRTTLGRADPSGGSMKVVTTKLKPGYLRKNGVPYSAKSTLTEYYDRLNEPNGDTYLTITLTIEDPTYLTQPYLTSAHFKKLADASGWNPTPCTAR